MAQMITILGAMIGFFAGLVGFFALDINFMTAFAIWAASGPAAAIIGFLIVGTEAKTVRTTPHRAFDAAA